MVISAISGVVWDILGIPVGVSGVDQQLYWVTFSFLQPQLVLAGWGWRCSCRGTKGWRRGWKDKERGLMADSMRGGGEGREARFESTRVAEAGAWLQTRLAHFSMTWLDIKLWLNIDSWWSAYMLDLVTGSFGQVATEMELRKPGAAPQACWSQVLVILHWSFVILSSFFILQLRALYIHVLARQCCGSTPARLLHVLSQALFFCVVSPSPLVL